MDRRKFFLGFGASAIGVAGVRKRIGRAEAGEQSSAVEASGPTSPVGNLPPEGYTFLAQFQRGTVLWKAYTPNVPGCFSNGKTIEETKRNIREAVEQHLVSMLAHAQPLPQANR